MLLEKGLQVRRTIPVEIIEDPDIEGAADVFQLASHRIHVVSFDGAEGKQEEDHGQKQKKDDVASEDLDKDGLFQVSNL